MAKSRAAKKIMVIRHAEKPNRSSIGVSLSGKESDKDLNVKGWQRAGALVPFFAPASGIFQDRRLAQPQFLFASMSNSRRSMQTLLPLSEKLGIPIKHGAKGQEDGLVDQATACAGVVLISWQHENIPVIAKHILTGSPDLHKVPDWPSERFDLVWIFDWDKTRETFRFSQVPERLLAGDDQSVIKPKSSTLRLLFGRERRQARR